MDYVRLGLFRIIVKILEVIYRLNLLAKIKIYLIDIAKIVQQKIKRYYNAKRFKGLDLKKGDKVWLLYKNFKS